MKREKKQMIKTCTYNFSIRQTSDLFSLHIQTLEFDKKNKIKRMLNEIRTQYLETDTKLYE